MPDPPIAKIAPHPYRSGADAGGPRARGARPYAELGPTSNFSFLRGASHPEELVRRAAELGHSAATIADRNSLAGVVRAHLAAEEVGIPLAVGCRLVFEDEALPELLVFPTTRASYGRLCRLLTDGKLRAEKGACHLNPRDLAERTRDLVGVVLPPRGRVDAGHARGARELVRLFEEDAISLAADVLGEAEDEARLRDLRRLSNELGAPLCATNDVHYHEPARRPLQDLLTCIRNGCTIEEAGLSLFPNAERHLKSAGAMARLFATAPGALDRAAEIAARAAEFSLRELDYNYPAEVEGGRASAIETLGKLTWAGARERYPGGVPDKVRDLVTRELRLVEELGYAPYFLTVEDIVRFARERRILCQGRGAAANSAICYCLGVTAVDPSRANLLFERFVSKERNEPPDIDIDFEHERREEVIQFLYEKYGRDRAGLTATVISYRGRSAVRETGKALGFSLELCDRLAKDIDWWDDGVNGVEKLRKLGLDPEATATQHLFSLSQELLGFPRHLSQHVGGFVVTADPLCELVPIENAAMEARTVIEWDKDDLDALGILKIDILGLGMLTAIRKCIDLVSSVGGPNVHIPAAGGFTVSTVPPEDPAVYDMLCAADTVGVFQVESRAQMSMLPRLRPRCFYDLVIEVAIVRPGPIHGDMVHPYLRRRNGEEAVEYPNPDVEELLERTLGVPLFQEQVMRLAVVAGGFTGGEADQLRRAIAAWKRKTTKVEELGEKLKRGMEERGYDDAFIERIWRQLHGFSEYGFPESHAASFALLVYVSSWLKLYQPAAFTAALLNSQPMGFYAPAQLVADARRHGVEVREVDVNLSQWDCTLEEAEDGPALRLGMRLVKGLRQDTADAIAEAVRRHGLLASPAALHQRSGVSAKRLRPLAYADAFRSMDLDRRAAAWAIRALRDEELPLFDRVGDEAEGAERLPRAAPLDEVMHDYASHRLSLRSHPVAFLRDTLKRLGVATSADLEDAEQHPQDSRTSVAGLVLVRQRPMTAQGILFMTIEDETGPINLVVFPNIFERYRKVARTGVLVRATGRVDRVEGVVHIVVNRIEELELPREAGTVPEPRTLHTSRDFR